MSTPPKVSTALAIRRLDAFLAGEIRLHGEHRVGTAGGARDYLRGLVEPRRAARANDDRGALGGQRLRARQPETAARPGDNGYLALKLQIHGR